MAEGPQITIDGTQVTLMYSSVYNGYSLVLFRSGEDMSFAYLSQSEGLWRLFVRIDPTTSWNPDARSETLKKGHDYVTTTQIHMKLQCFITEHIDELPRVDPARFRDIFFTKPGTPRGDRVLSAIGYLNPLRTLIPEIPLASYKPVRTREFLHPVFEPLTIACDANCFKDTYAKIYSRFSTLRRTGLLIESEYLKKLKQLFGIGVKDSLINTSTFKNESVISKEDRYKTLVAVLSAYMRHYFTLSRDPSEYICTLPMNISSKFRNAGGRDTQYAGVMPIRVYRTTITLTSEFLPFHLYYGTYTLEDGSPNAGSYKIILNLLPSTSRLGEFGLNESYISANMYVYKMFEYSGIQSNRADKSVMYSGRYNFIGDLLTDMWPMKNVVEPVAAVAAVEEAAAEAVAEEAEAVAGGRRRRNTRRRRRTLRRK